MALALGIDTGGTYTDGVIYDLASQETIAKAKALTTYHDLTIGIRNCIRELQNVDLAAVNLVALSTTLATNAIVEGRGGEVGLLLIGDLPTGALPVNHYALIQGGHDLQGNPKAELDLSAVRQALEDWQGKVDAMAISGFLSVRNPEHELQVKQLVHEIMDVPVVCGHQLTSSLGFQERSVTAALNAKLIPIIANLINSVKKVLQELNINAQLMIVKGDGSLMSDVVALEKPIETILSGPAASIIGATALTQSPAALVLDMGGTTTDIAILQDGIPRLNQEGALVGGWLTRVQAAAINTYGIGGDSLLKVTNDGKLAIGPQKVWPLAVIGDKYPYLLAELKEQQQLQWRLPAGHITDGYMLVRPNQRKNLTEVDQGALELLSSGPHSLLFLANHLNKDPYVLNLQPLVENGTLARIGVTPTDILHVQGKLSHWNQEIAQVGVEMLAKAMKLSVPAFLTRAFQQIVDKLALTVLESILNFEKAPYELTQNLANNYFVNKLLSPQTKEILSCQPKINIPIVGIGAPVQAYLPEVAKKLGAELIIPLHSEVANAIGAATGKVMEKVSVLINSAAEGGFIMYSQWERKTFQTLVEAKKYALAHAKEQAGLAAQKAGTEDYQLMIDEQDKYANGKAGFHVETRVEVTAIGRPKW